MTRETVEGHVRTAVVLATSLVPARVVLGNRYGTVPGEPFASVLLLSEESPSVGGLRERLDSTTGRYRWTEDRVARVGTQFYGRGAFDLASRFRGWLRGPGAWRQRGGFGGMLIEPAGTVVQLDDLRDAEFEERASLMLRCCYLATVDPNADLTYPLDEVGATVESIEGTVPLTIRREP